MCDVNHVLFVSLPSWSCRGQKVIMELKGTRETRGRQGCQDDLVSQGDQDLW